MKHLFVFKDYYLATTNGESSIFEVRIEVIGDAPDNLELGKITLHHPNMQPLEMTETQFQTIFPGGDDICNNAFEEAASVEMVEFK